jgi:hypothetical protein
MGNLPYLISVYQSKTNLSSDESGVGPDGRGVVSQGAEPPGWAAEKRPEPWKGDRSSMGLAGRVSDALPELSSLTDSESQGLPPPANNGPPLRGSTRQFYGRLSLLDLVGKVE